MVTIQSRVSFVALLATIEMSDPLTFFYLSFYYILFSFLTQIGKLSVMEGILEWVLFDRKVFQIPLQLLLEL